MGSMISTTGMKTSLPHGKECEHIENYNLQMCLLVGGAAMTLPPEGSCGRGLFSLPFKVSTFKVGAAILVAVSGIS